MANFWTAFGRLPLFRITVGISLITKPRDEKELVGLVYSLTEKPSEEHLSWYQRPCLSRRSRTCACLVLNHYFQVDGRRAMGLIFVIR